jgi:hypothetical protein
MLGDWVAFWRDHVSPLRPPVHVVHSTGGRHRRK